MNAKKVGVEAMEKYEGEKEEDKKERREKKVGGENDED